MEKEPKLKGEEEEIIKVLKKQLEKRFRVANVKSKFDDEGNFYGFTYDCPEEEHDVKARAIDKFFKDIGLKNPEYIV